MSKENINERLASLFKEEQWGRIDPKNIGISKFKILEDFFNNLISESMEDEVAEQCRTFLESNEHSVTAAYLLGVIAYHKNVTDEKVELKSLIDLFLKHHKWAVVEHIAEKILEYGENRIALKALAQSLERLSRLKEAIPVWEELLKIDRFDAEVAKKLSFAIIEDEPAKSIQYMKLSIEGFIKSNELDEISELWSKLIDVSWDDVTFFERIERMLVDAKRPDLAAEMLRDLFSQYKTEDKDQAIEILKKILKYSPNDIASRRSLVTLYTDKYSEHSQFRHFLEISKLNDYNFPVSSAIESFQKNIIFDKGNYAHHRSWGLGIISNIDSEKVIIDFDEKPDHQMSIQMALQSLVPVGKDHFYVLQKKDYDGMKKLFDENFTEFFNILIKSYGGQITVSSIKKELLTKYVDQKNWSKWWSKARTRIKKDPLFGMSDKAKDVIYVREKPVTYADELLNRFLKSTSFSNKLDVALEFVNNIENQDGKEIVEYMVDFFKGATKEGSDTKLILSYFILNSLSKFTGSSKLNLSTTKENVINFIKQSKDLSLISMKISSYDYKKEFVNLIEEVREDWLQVLTGLMFETPVRIHRYIINTLMRARAYKQINSFIDKVINGGKQFPEIFLWVSKSIYTKTWDYQWLDFSKAELTLSHFRVMNELKKVEVGKNRLKNIAVELLFDSDAQVLREIVSENELNFINKVFDMALSIDYIEESYREKFVSIIEEKFPDFKVTEVSSGNAEVDYGEEELIVTQSGFDKKSEELSKMVNVEMVQLSKELSKTADLTGDVRENVDYNALMEKQAILKLSISKLDTDLKRAKILNMNDVSTDEVAIGTVVNIKSVDNDDTRKFAILGPWDADFDNEILSYRSPMAKSLLKKKINDETELRYGESTKKYKIVEINVYGG